MPVTLELMEITKQGPNSFQFRIPPKYITKKKLSTQKTYNVICYSSMAGPICLRNRRILSREMKRGEKIYIEYRITVPKSVVYHNILPQGVDYTLEMSESG